MDFCHLSDTPMVKHFRLTKLILSIIDTSNHIAYLINKKTQFLEFVFMQIRKKKMFLNQGCDHYHNLLAKEIFSLFANICSFHTTLAYSGNYMKCFIAHVALSSKQGAHFMHNMQMHRFDSALTVKGKDLEQISLL